MPKKGKTQQALTPGSRVLSLSKKRTRQIRQKRTQKKRRARRSRPASLSPMSTSVRKTIAVGDQAKNHEGGPPIRTSVAPLMGQNRLSAPQFGGDVGDATVRLPSANKKKRKKPASTKPPKVLSAPWESGISTKKPVSDNHGGCQQLHVAAFAGSAALLACVPAAPPERGGGILSSTRARPTQQAAVKADGGLRKKAHVGDQADQHERASALRTPSRPQTRPERRGPCGFRTWQHRQDGVVAGW